MTTRNHSRLQEQTPDPEPNRSSRKLLSVRSALVLILSLVSALIGAGLLYLAHQPVALIVFLAVGVFVGAVKFWDWAIE